MKKSLLLAVAAAMSVSTVTASVNRADSKGFRQRGVEMFDNGNYAGCIDQLTHALRIAGVSDWSSTEDIRYYIAMASLKQGTAGAADLLKAFLTDYPSSARRGDVRVALGDYYYDRGDLAAAIEQYDAVDPSSLNLSVAAAYRYHLAYCLMMNGEFERAGALYDILSRDGKYANDARFYKAYIEYVRDDYDRALDLFRKVTPHVSGPTSMTDYYLSQIYYTRKDFDHALSTATRLLDRDVPQEFRAEALRVAGESAYSLDRPAEAVELLNDYVKLTDSPLPSAMYVLGLSRYDTGDYQGAISDLAAVTKEDNAMGQSAYLLIGQCYCHLGQYRDGIIAFDKAYRMEYDSDIRETALYNYAVAKMQGGNVPFGSSVATLETFLSRYPASRYAPEVQEYIVTGYMTDNNYEAALASINKIKNPTDAVLKAKQQVLYTLGTRDLASDRVSSALNRFREAKALGARNPEIARETDLWIGEALYKEGKYDQAAKSYEAYIKASATSPNRAVAYYDLGYARFGQKEFGQAYTAFDTFIKKPGSASSLMKADALNRMADCKYYGSEFERAVQLYDRAFETDPAAGDYALYQKAMMKGMRRDHRGKIEGLKDMMTRFPQSGLYPSALLEIADAWQELGENGKVVETYTALVDRYPSTAQGRQGRLLLAITYLNGSNRSKAVEIYKEVITSYPSSEEARVAADDLKRIYADDGNLASFVAFMKSVPDAPSIDPSELESMAFDSAEKAYRKSGDTRLLEKYIEEYPSGASLPEALVCLSRSSAAKGDSRKSLSYASRVVDSYPHSASAQEAYLLKADAEMDLDMTRDALETYRRLESVAGNASSLNAARLGIMRVARDLGEAELSLTAADRILASSTIGTGNREEVRFSRAIALNQLGRGDEAESEWASLAADPQTLYGSKSAYYLAQHYFDSGNTAEARRSVEALIDANPPHNYWLARGFILLSDINRKEGNDFEADEYLKTLRENYPGTEADIFTMIDQRLK